MQERQLRPGTPPSRSWYLFSGALIVLVSLVTAAALSDGSALAQTQASPPANTAQPAISGTAVRGQTVTASSGSWTGDAPITFAYQWRRCNVSGASCVDIASATGTAYVVADADVGSTLRVQVDATNSAGSASALSNATATVVASTAPVNTGEPRVTGSPVEDATLTASNGSWSSATPVSYAYQWVRCPANGGTADGSNCTFLSGATGTTYRLQSADVGSRMRVRVTATNSVGKQTAASNPTDAVQSSGVPASTSQPAIAGTPRQGEKLTATAGAWSGSQPIGVAYQWVRCGSDGGAADGSNCAVIANARSATYVASSDDVGRRLRVRVTASNSRGSRTAASNATAAVQAGPVLPAGAVKLSGGKISIPASSMALPARLIVDGIRFTPNPVRSRRAPIEVRVHVVDTRGYFVRDVLVFARSTPRLTTGPGEVRTGQDGWAVVRLTPRASFPLRARGHVQFFVRVRKDGDNLLAGVSTRRLVQVSTAR
jgi:hypothetical protein